ncbi:hypothetical protein MHM86_05280 [Thalassobius sp. Cn5-15]|jgi:hypothetical protein|nr:hypothetical protein [Thalassobius sp. Cn5-15]
MSSTRHTFRNIPDELILEAKIHALQTGRTLSQLVQDALEYLMSEEAENPD